MKKPFLTGILFTTVIGVLACYNHSLGHLKVHMDGTMEHGDFKYVPKGLDLKTSKNFYKELLQQKAEELKTDNNASHLNDYGVLLSYLGRFEEAKKIFEKAEKNTPGLYGTAANLGTTYELLGKNDSALIWIKKGLQRNPQSHEGSEWIHVNILKTKLLNDTSKITSRTLIGTDLGNDSLPKTTLASAELIKLRNHIYHQLEERMTFVKPKDKYVALLLYDLGNIVAITDDLNSALYIYEKAQAYGYDTETFHKRITAFSKIQKKAVKGQKNK